jgi:NADH dehydrogenase
VTVLVVGATGDLGGLIARSLLEQGAQVRILVREGSSYDDLVELGAEAVPGDLKDAASLRTACAGVETVITTANSVARGGEDTVESVDRKGNLDLIEAAAGAGVRRFIFISALGANASSPEPFMRAKGEAEEALRESGMTWTIFQPNIYMELWIPMMVGGPALAGKPVTLVGEGRRRHSMVARQDVAAYALAALENKAADDQTLVIGGPEPLSWRDIIAAFEDELGRPIPVQSIPLGQPMPGFPPAVTGLVTALETYDSPIDMSGLVSSFGVTPSPVADFIRDFIGVHAGAGG